MAKKRKKKQAAKQAPRPAQSKSVAARDTKAKAESKKTSAAPQSKARRWVWLVVAILLVAGALLIARTVFRQTEARPTGPWTLTILHTTDVAGYIDPCG